MTSYMVQAPYARYLTAKRGVDDRSIHAGVLSWVRGALHQAAPRVVEVGGGIGTMVGRLYERGIVTAGEYHLVDEDAALLAEARWYLAGWAADRGVAARPLPDGICLGALTVRLVQAEIGAYADGAARPAADLLIGCAVLDVLDAPRVLPGLLRLLRPGGTYWFPITYDGEMSFQPDHVADRAVVGAYHRDMDHRLRRGRPAGERFAGRHLLGHLSAAGAPVQAAGASDWVVLPETGGHYPPGESAFVAGILDTMAAALTPAAQGSGEAPDVDPVVLADWLGARRDQLARGELVYLAHNLDLAGRTSP